MSTIGTFIDQMAAAMAAGFPARHCTRDMYDFGDRDEAQLVDGIYTFMADGQPPDDDDYATFISVLLIGQFIVPEDAAPSALEEVELTMVDEIRALKRAASVNIQIRGVQQSRQIELPYGWVRTSLRVGPLDLTPPAPDAELDDFLTFHADWDIPPHVSAAEHGKWLDEPPDHDTTAPEASDDVDLPQ
ncbi:MAG: hypothetical protein AB7Q81_24370 [Gammaproteobacteria bacterium]